MRRKRGGYGMQESYAGYGLTAGRAKALLNECREGKYVDLVQEAARQAEPRIAEWIVSSIMEGKSFDRMAVKWELGEAEMMPCCRNSFYAYRKFTLAILDDMLAGKEVGQMGNYNSGGHNRTHGRVEEYCRIDSFRLLQYADRFERLSDYGEYHYPVMGGKIYYNLMEDTARISHNGREYPLGLYKVPNVDGLSYRLYFLCPKCQKRARHLYKKDGLYQCRKCARLNYGIQQRSGLSLIRRKMYWLVVKKLQYVDWEVDHPDLPIQDLWHIPKPRYMRWAKYDVLMEEYRRLQKEYETMYNESLMKAFERINKLLG